MKLNSAPPAVRLSLEQADRLRKDTLGLMQEILCKHGDFVKVKLAIWDLYLLNHPDYIKRVTLDNWKNYGRETFQFKNFARVTGQGLLTTHGDKWQQDRRLIQPAFHKQVVAGMRDEMMQAINRMHSNWDRHIASGKPQINIDHEMLKLGLDIIMRTLFSYDLNADDLQTENESNQTLQFLSQEILGLMHYVIYRSQNLAALPLPFPTRQNITFRRRLHQMNRLVARIIAERRTQQSDETAPNDLMTLLLANGQQAGGPLTERQIRDQMVTMIIAGYETVATGMSWIWFQLSQALEWQEKLYTEISAPAGEGSPAQIAQAIINETFRLNPPSWLITRRALGADKIGPFDVPAGALIVISPYAIHRDHRFWSDPTLFDPNRFLNDYAKVNRFSYIPFGDGPHLCIGKPLALMEAELTLMQTIGKFRIKPTVDQLPTHHPMVTLRPSLPLTVALERR